jgi:putative endonuclease
MKFYYTYVLRSKIDNNLYIGWTDNLEKRLILHNNGKVAPTKSRIPLDLIYFEGCKSKKRAISREKQFKTGFGRKFLKRRLG